MAFGLRRSVVVFVAAFVSCGLLSAGSAGASEREEMTDLFLFGHFAANDETTAEQSFFGADVDITFDDTFGGGFGIGRNVNDYININATLLLAGSEIGVETSGGALSASEDVFVVEPDINFDWNILDTDVTPFVTAGAGIMFLFGDDDNETEFTYGVGVGVRWDISHDAFMKVWYRAKWFELDDTEDAIMQNTFNIAIGIMR